VFFYRGKNATSRQKANYANQQLADPVLLYIGLQILVYLALFLNAYDHST
jgi:hypothetical protein